MFNVKGRNIGVSEAPFVIAEMSGNHNQSLECAFQIIEAAANAGVDALKIQTYTADTMTIDSQNSDFMINDEKSLWKGQSLYQLYQKAYTPWEWQKEIFKKCHDLGIIGFSTPFDVTAVDFLEKLNVPCYKIASFENTDHILLRKVASTHKPVFMSIGMATLEEISESVSLLKENGCTSLALLKCTSSYPALPNESNIITIKDICGKFSCCAVGLSDHTMGFGVAVASIALGSSIIEKHFTLSRAEGGVDSAFSVEPEEMKRLIEECKKAWQSIGEIKYGPTNSEISAFKYRRSLYFVSNLRKGEKITAMNVRSIRPAFGLATKYYDFILGRRVAKDVEKGTPVSWDLVGE
ncbi:MAG: pseudaminic acid synthase [Candidatus Omnitrophota bacterium]|nr:pseudaminic acid synthase [Candidatus Omnitrophota bacterium]